MTYQVGDRIRDREDHRSTGVVARAQTSATTVLVNWDDPESPENPYAVPVWFIEPVAQAAVAGNELDGEGA